MRIGKVHIELDAERESYIKHRIIDANNKLLEVVGKSYKEEIEEQRVAYEKIIDCCNKTKINLICELENSNYELKKLNEKKDIAMTNLDLANKELEEANKLISEYKKQLDAKDTQIEEIVKINNALGQVLRKDIAIKKQMVNALREKSIKVWKLVDLVKLIG